LEAANELGYVPNNIARSLRLNRTMLIGLLIADVENSFYSVIAKNVESVAVDAGYSVVLCNSNDNPADELKYLRLLETIHVDGMILTPTGGNRQVLERLQKKGIELVQIDRVVEGLNADAVLVDNEAGAAAGVSHLIQAGHTRIGILSGSLEVTTGKQRLAGYERALRDNCIPFVPELVKAGSFRQDHAIADARSLIGLDPAPTAIFAANNILAEACMLALSEAWLHVPKDISLVAFDDTKWMGITNPPITTVRQPVAEMAREAAKILLGRLQSAEQNQPNTVTFAPELIKRSSVTTLLREA
jgi:LacI family transcriptional regulator